MKSSIQAAPVSKRPNVTAENRACGGRGALTIAARFVPSRARKEAAGFTAENRACGGRHAITVAARFILRPL